MKARGNIILGKLEGSNPGGSVKDRPVLSMSRAAEARGSARRDSSWEIWNDTQGEITHFVSAMGTTGTIMGAGRYLREQNPRVTIVGAQPEAGSQIAGIRKWRTEYQPRIYDATQVDRLELVSQTAAEAMARRFASEEGMFADRRRPAPA